MCTPAIKTAMAIWKLDYQGSDIRIGIHKNRPLTRSFWKVLKMAYIGGLLLQERWESVIDNNDYYI